MRITPSIPFLMALSLSMLTATGPRGARAQGSPEQPGQPAAQELTAEQRVLSMMHQVNRFEIEAGQLAETRGQSEEIQRYGDLLVKDHRMADQRVESLAQSEGITLRDIPLQIPVPGQQQMQPAGQVLDHLRQLEGDAFDRYFAQVMQSSHQHAIQRLEQAMEQLEDPQVRTLVDQQLPILEQHRELAEEIREELQEDAAEDDD